MTFTSLLCCIFFPMSSAYFIPLPCKFVVTAGMLPNKSSVIETSRVFQWSLQNLIHHNINTNSTLFSDTGKCLWLISSCCGLRLFVWWQMNMVLTGVGCWIVKEMGGCLFLTMTHCEAEAVIKAGLYVSSFGLLILETPVCLLLAHLLKWWQWPFVKLAKPLKWKRIPVTAAETDDGTEHHFLKNLFCSASIGFSRKANVLLQMDYSKQIDIIFWNLTV